MKRFVLLLGALLGLACCANAAHAGFGALTYSGYQPWWNIFAKRPCQSPEEARLQKFWHDYYHAMKEYYASLDHIDWVAYYKNHGYMINGGCGGNGCCQRINYAPVFVSPTVQWAMPSSCIGGLQCQPGCGGGYPGGGYPSPGGAYPGPGYGYAGYPGYPMGPQ
jgi:hypothetical protein